MSIWLQKSASIQKRTSPLKFDKFRWKIPNCTASYLSTKVAKVAEKPGEPVGGQAAENYYKRLGMWSQLWSAKFAIFKLQEARSRLYRNRFLQPNTHFLAFFAIYKICTPSHRSKLKIFAKIRQTFFRIFARISARIIKNPYFSTIFIEFCTDFDDFFRNFAEHSRKCWEVLKFVRISEKLW